MNTRIIFRCCLALLFLSLNTLYSQDTKDAEEALYDLYEQNIRQWKNTEDVKSLIEQHPELNQIIEKLDYRDIDQSTNYKIMGFLERLTDEALLDNQVDMLIEVLSPENVNFIEQFYWKIINSPKSKKVADLLVDHLVDAKEKLEKDIKTLERN